jgi:anti-sigma B factor antagonist
VQGARDVSQRGDWTVVEVTGDLDLAAAPGLRRDVLALLSDGRRQIVLDLSATGFLDSVGLGTIVAVWKRIRVHGGALAVVCPDPRLQRVFRVVDLDRVLPLHASLDEATGAHPSSPDSVSPRE